MSGYDSMDEVDAEFGTEPVRPAVQDLERIERELRALVEKWKRQECEPRDSSDDYHIGTDEQAGICADELLALLDSWSAKPEAGEEG